MIKSQGFDINSTKRNMSRSSNSKGISSKQPNDNNRFLSSAEATKRKWNHVWRHDHTRSSKYPSYLIKFAQHPPTLVAVQPWLLMFQVWFPLLLSGFATKVSPFLAKTNGRNKVETWFFNNPWGSNSNSSKMKNY